MRPRHPQTADVAVAVGAVDDHAETVTSWVRRLPGTAFAMATTVMLLVIGLLVVSFLVIGLLAVGEPVAAAGAVSPSQGGGGLTPAVSATPAAGVFTWPLAGAPVVVAAFDPPAEPWLPGHRGVDLAATLGQPVYAAGAGTVSFAGRIAGTGVVSVTHPDGLRSTYEPVAASVRTGDRVAVGTPIGTIDARLSHCPSRPAACLHWGLIRGEVYLDPLMLLGLGRVRLYPSP